jgi:hypothetical protein
MKCYVLFILGAAKWNCANIFALSFRSVEHDNFTTLSTAHSQIDQDVPASFHANEVQRTVPSTDEMRPNASLSLFNRTSVRQRKQKSVRDGKEPLQDEEGSLYFEASPFREEAESMHDGDKFFAYEPLDEESQSIRPITLLPGERHQRV